MQLLSVLMRFLFMLQYIKVLNVQVTKTIH